MNSWPFVIAAYSLTAVGTALVSIWSWRAARDAEKRADQLRRERD
jgi:hypothetical protein